ncbi:recombinase family protein [Mucilaginibacter endophyticus]|uniref:recombinase family protein n=1 Tax=Mucilaginibacter endophyticus TaxID=2675003 RepID=UPI000E0D41A3|nr:recombinase family protein [Mucilaginibacter endophyticus]
MKSAYLYVRVSTDEQRRKGFSLIEQEDRLIKYCEANRVKIIEIFREDFSAKDFNRPEWKRLIRTIKKKNKRPDYILFIKWDRFSRNVALAYQMIKVLQDLNVQAIAIDQPVNFEVPESSVMLAIYLAIPEAENLRRGLNCSDGMRRARKLGRWPGRAPVGYTNLIGTDGRGFVAPKQPEANQIKRAFEEFARGTFSISEVRKMLMLDGLQCSRNNFWKLLRNPFYCGIITVPPNAKEELQLVKGIHEPLISEQLFYDVQIILKGRHHPKVLKENSKILFPLRGVLKCPYCHKRLTGSASKGRHAKYCYYHCITPKCKGRFGIKALHQSYEEELDKISLR